MLLMTQQSARVQRALAHDCATSGTEPLAPLGLRGRSRFGSDACATFRHGRDLDAEFALHSSQTLSG